MDHTVLLLSQGKTLSEIAEATGYSTPYNLSRAFKKKFGVSPNEFKKARKILGENKRYLDVMARLLIERETIFTEEVEMIMEGKSAEEIMAFMDEHERTLMENPFERKNPTIIKEEINEEKTETENDQSSEN